MAAAQAGILFLLLYQGYAMVGGERGERRKKKVGTTWEEIAASFSVRLKEGAVCIQSIYSIRECFNLLLGHLTYRIGMFTILTLTYTLCRIDRLV